MQIKVINTQNYSLHTYFTIIYAFEVTRICMVQIR